jgi:DNA-binding beta-propeller fold protein YncE
MRTAPRLLSLIVCAAVALLAIPGRTVVAAIISGGPPRPDIDNFGREVDPKGRLTELGYFVTGSALTPNGRFLWTVGAGRVDNDIQITRASDGKVLQTIDDPSQALQGGMAISPNGLHAYVSDTQDNVGVRTYTIDPRTGLAQAGPTIPLPPPSGAPTPDNFPPSVPGSSKQSYAAGMAISPDGRTLVVAENLADYAAVINLQTRAVTQVQLDKVSPIGDHAMPEGVAIIGDEAYVTDEGNGTISAFDYAQPDPAVDTVTPEPATPDPVYVDPTKTHPFQIIAAPDGKALYVSETNDDRILILNPTDLSAPAGVIYVRRSEGLGTDPLGMAITPDGNTLFVADANENAVRAIALTARTIREPNGATERVAAEDTIAWIPSGIYPDRVALDPHTERLLIVSAEGVGPGATGKTDTAAGGYGDPQQDSIRMLSALQTFQLPLGQSARDTDLLKLGRGGFNAAIPVGYPATPPANTPVEGPGGGPSTKIKYVFYVVAENKTYDSMLGDLTRNPKDPTEPGVPGSSVPVGNGDPCLVIFGLTRSMPHNFDGSPCPQSRFIPKDVAIRDPGMRMDGTPLTPNQHKIALQFVDLDNLYADTTTSDDGHLFTASGYSDDYEVRGTEANNGPSPRPFDLIYPQAAPPQGFLFDLMAEDHISFFNYGEAVSGTLIPDTGLSPSEQLIRKQVLANSDYVNYPSSAAIDVNPVSVGVNPDVDSPASLAAVGEERVDDSDQPDELQDDVYTKSDGVTVPTRQSRMLYFAGRFDAEVDSPGCVADPGDPKVCNVPQFEYLVMPNNHTAGTTPGRRTPDALVRDNDLAIGQLADLISHSRIWPYSAIFVIQDDPQDGADHVDAHRIAAYLISPWARHEAVDSTHYDQAGVIHTMELILGVRPQYFQDALATPLFNAFTTTPDYTPFDDIPISQTLLDEVNPPNSPMAQVSERQLWQADRVNPNLANQIMYAYRYGTTAACPTDLGDDANDPCQIKANPSTPVGDPVLAARRNCPITWACRNLGSDGDG